MLGLIFNLVLTSATALPSIRGERLFRVERQGRVSHVLAVAHESFPITMRLVPVERAVAASCRVFLQGDAWPESVSDGAAVYGFDLRGALSRAQRQTYRAIVGDHARFHALQPEYASLLIRELLPTARDRARARYEDRAGALSEDERHDLMDRVVFNPHLIEATRALFGDALPLGHRVDQMAELARTEDDDEVQTMNDLVERTARGAEVPLKLLHPPPHGSSTEVLLALHDLSNLRLMLDDLREWMDDAHAPSLHANLALSHLLSWELSQRYFSLEPAAYGRVRDLLARSLATNPLLFTGDETLAVQEANVHAAWTPIFRAAVARGGAFIALDVERVIPGVDRRVRRTLLEELEAAGATITPLAAERGSRR